jgi:acetate kinase
MHILAINSGSSSLKYALFESDEGGERPIVRGGIDRIGEVVPDHGVAVNSALDTLAAKGHPMPDAVGHRVLHGGARFSAPALVNDALIECLEELVPLGPLHEPPQILGIRAVAARWPKLPQVACFDTAFHRTMSEVAQRYAIPDELCKDGIIRRYGFHGLSYEFIVSTVGAKELGSAVIAHLGAGSSLAAVREGRCVDTTMGFTPTAGLVMGSRIGDADPGLLLYLLDHGYDVESLRELVTRRSGLIGVSGTTADVRQLLSARASDPRAALALDLFVWNARKWIGAMAASACGIQTLVFTGGIGQHATVIRSEIAAGLKHLGVELDEERNARSDRIISSDSSRCKVLVVATDEERMVVRHTQRVVNAAS